MWDAFYGVSRFVYLSQLKSEIRLFPQFVRSLLQPLHFGCKIFCRDAPGSDTEGERQYVACNGAFCLLLWRVSKSYSKMFTRGTVITKDSSYRQGVKGRRHLMTSQSDPSDRGCSTIVTLITTAVVWNNQSFSQDLNRSSLWIGAEQPVSYMGCPGIESLSRLTIPSFFVVLPSLSKITLW